MNKNSGPTANSDQTSNDQLADWMKRAQDGDRNAYRDLLKALLPIVGRLVARNSGSSSNEFREEIVQEVMVAVHDKRRTYDPSRPLLPWVTAIARFKTVDAVRGRRRQELSVDPDEFERIAAEPLDSGDDEFLNFDAEKLMADLSGKQREVLKLTKLEGLSIKQTALKLNLSEADVKVNVHRAIQALKKTNKIDRRK